MSQQNGPNYFQVGDYVDAGTEISIPKLITKITQEGFQLKDPVFQSSSNENINYPLQKLKLFRTRTKLRDFIPSSIQALRRKFEVSQIEDMTRDVEKVMENLLTASPKELIQLLRGRLYFLAHSLLVSQIQGDFLIGAINLLFKAVRKLFLKYIISVDFAQFKPQNIYSDSMNALCSGYVEIYQLLQISTGFHLKFHDHRRNCQKFFRNQAHQKDIQDWLQSHLLPQFAGANHSIFPIGFQINLLILVQHIVKRVKLQVSQPLNDLYTLLYNQILAQIGNIFPNNNRQLQLFYQNMLQIFTTMYIGRPLSQQAIHLQPLQTQKNEYGTQETKNSNSNKMQEEHYNSNSQFLNSLITFEKQKKKAFTQYQYTKICELEFRSHIAYAYLLRGDKENLLPTISYCVDEINRFQLGKDPKIKEDKIHLKQNWPLIAQPFFNFIQEKKFLQQIFNNPKIQQYLAVTRVLVDKLYVYIPKKVILCCFNNGKHNFVKNILGSKLIKEDVCQWLFDYLIKWEAQQSKPIKPMLQFLKFLQIWMKGRQIFLNYNQNRKRIIEKLYQLGSRTQNMEFNIFQSVLLLNDNIRTSVFENFCTSSIFPQVKELQNHFKEYILARYCLSRQVSISDYENMLEPMLVREKDLKIYERRKNAIINILHRLYSLPNKQNYISFLKMFIQYYSRPQHDKKLPQNKWKSFSIYPKIQLDQFSFVNYVDQQFCKKVLPKILPLSCELDILVFNELLIKYNSVKKMLSVNTPKNQINEVLTVPLFFKEMIEPYYNSNLEKNELKIHEQYLNKYFVKAKQNVYYEMMKIFLDIIIRNGSSGKEANQAFKNLKTRSQHLWPIAQKPTNYHKSVPEYKLKFKNQNLIQKMQKYSYKYINNYLRIGIIQEQKKSSTLVQAKNYESLASIKQRLAFKLNKQPGEIVMITLNGDYLTPAQQLNSLGMEILCFASSDAQRQIEKTFLQIRFCLKQAKTPIYKSLLDHAKELFQQMPKSSLILQGIDLKVQSWYKFDDSNIISNNLEKIVSDSQIPATYIKNQYLQNCLIDYFLWRKEEEDLRLYDFRCLYPLFKKIEDTKDIVFNLRISYLVYASGCFKVEDREKILDLLLFSHPTEAINSRLDKEQVYSKLNDLVYKILESKYDGALQFCFTTNLSKIAQVDYTFSRFKNYWVKMYQQSSIEQKQYIFQSIQERMVGYPQNMREVGSIICEKDLCDPQEVTLYQLTLFRIVEQMMRLVKSINIPKPTKTIKLLLATCAQFLKNGFDHQIIHSKQFVFFLLQHIYTYAYVDAQLFFQVLDFALNNQISINFALNFFEEEIKEPEWSKLQILDSPRRHREMQDQGLVGLLNTRNVCFANSLFQQLFHIKSFRDDLLATQWQKGQNPDEDIILQLKKIFINLKESRQPHINLQFFVNAFNIYGVPLQAYEQMDADEFKNVLFYNLEKLLPTNMFWKKLFVGNQVSKITCLQCNNVSNTQQTFDSIHLTVQEHSLQKSLQAYIKSSILQNENAYSCQKCKKKVRAQKQININKLPPYLVFVLKRFEYSHEANKRTKLSDYFQFPFDNLQWTSQQRYNLKGIICHIGQPEKGHYISFIKLENQWYQFNDMFVGQVSYDLVKNSTAGTDKTGEKIQTREKTAYLLYYQAVDNPSTSMDIQSKVYGVSEEIGKIHKERNIIAKQRTFFNANFLQFMVNINSKYPQEKCTKLLLTTLIDISFKVKLLQEDKPSKYHRNVIQSLRILFYNKNKLHFMWQEFFIQKIIELLKGYVPGQYKAILGYLLIENCPNIKMVAEEVLDTCLRMIYTPTFDNSIFYYILYGMVKKFVWAEQYVLEKRCVGRILDVALQGIATAHMRDQLKQTCELAFQYGQQFEATSMRQGLRYYRWALLAYLVQRNYTLLNQKQLPFIMLQTHQVFQRYFDECKSKAQMRYLNQYLCFLSSHLQIEFTNKLLNTIKDLINKDKPDSLRKYLKAIKDLVSIRDDFQQIRNNYAITILFKLLQNVVGQATEYVWLWLLKIANKNQMFRKKLSQNKILFDPLLSKNFSPNSTLLSRYQRTNNYPKTRYPLHKIQIAQNHQQFVQLHNRKIQKTKQLFKNCVFQPDLTEEDSDADIADETDFSQKIYRFREATQDYEAIQVCFVIGDIIVVYSTFPKERFPTSRTLFKGDQTLYLTDPSSKVDSEKSTPRKKPKEQIPTEKDNFSNGN